MLTTLSFRIVTFVSMLLFPRELHVGGAGPVWAPVPVQHVPLAPGPGPGPAPARLRPQCSQLRRRQRLRPRGGHDPWAGRAAVGRRPRPQVPLQLGAVQQGQLGPHPHRLRPRAPQVWGRVRWEKGCCRVCPQHSSSQITVTKECSKNQQNMKLNVLCHIHSLHSFMIIWANLYQVSGLKLWQRYEVYTWAANKHHAGLMAYQQWK